MGRYVIRFTMSGADSRFEMPCASIAEAVLAAKELRRGGHNVERIVDLEGGCKMVIRD